jgi:hypothetical protein
MIGMDAVAAVILAVTSRSLVTTALTIVVSVAAVLDTRNGDERRCDIDRG